MGTRLLTSDNILFTKVQQQVLKLLYLNQNSDFSTREIIRYAGSGNGAVQRELAKLISANYIIVNKVGNQKRYQANQKLPYYSELRSIIIKTFGLADVLKNSFNDLFIKNIKIAFIYGSVAKGGDTSYSDIDLMLIGEDLTYADIFNTIKNVEITLQRKVNPTFYSEKKWINRIESKNNFVTKVIEQPKIFLIGNDYELGKIR